MGNDSDKPTLLVLRHHGLGDLLTVQPALCALRRAFPEHRLVATCPSWLVPLAEQLGNADLWVAEAADTTVSDGTAVDPSCHQQADAPLLANVLTQVPVADVLVSLRTPGPELLPIVEALKPRLLISYRYQALPTTERFPELDFSDHILTRWQRLLITVGVEPRAEDLYAAIPVPESHRGFTIVHVGAGSPARLWPVDRWVEIVKYLESAGHHVILTGSEAEAPRVAEVRRRAFLDLERDLSGKADIMELGRLVAGARLVLCVDTGISHLATTFRRPAVTLFGPVPPAWWGPPPDNPQHRTLWTGRHGENYGEEVDPGLLKISVGFVLNVIKDMHPDGAAA